MVQRIGTQSIGGANEKAAALGGWIYQPLLLVVLSEGISEDYTNYLIAFLKLCFVCMWTIMSIHSTDNLVSRPRQEPFSKYSVDRDILKKEVEDKMLLL